MSQESLEPTEQDQAPLDDATAPSAALWQEDLVEPETEDVTEESGELPADEVADEPVAD